MQRYCPELSSFSYGCRVDGFRLFQYAEKAFVPKITDKRRLQSVAEEVWESVRSNDPRAVYRYIVCYGADVNNIYGQSSYCTSSPSVHNSRLMYVLGKTKEIL